MKDELGGKIMTEFVALRPKTNSYLTDDCEEDKKAKGTKKCVIKRRLKFNDYKDCLLNNQIVLKSQKRFNNERHDLYTEEINKIALSSNYDKRLQTFDRITSYPCGTSPGKVCKTELLYHFKDPKVFMEYSNDMEGVYKNIENYNPGKKRKILIVFDDMIADMINNKKLNPVVTELFIRGRKFNISIVFITQSYFKVPKDVRLNSTNFFIMKIQKKREHQMIL